MLEKFKEIFGSASKWVLLGLIVVIVGIAIVLLVFFVSNMKWILLGSSVAVVLAVIGYVLYKKFKK